ncbi:MAG: 3'-5' exonuclease [Paludibacteraceae bacterium]|nr:3'-5' exonuclease [Paludibacteraceae bacterium]
MILFFDTETTGVPLDYNAPITNSYNWPRLVQLAWILSDESGKEIKRKVAIIRPEGYTIPYEASTVHGITTDYALRNGQSLKVILDEFIKNVENVKLLVGHNIDFDQHIVGAELYRLGLSSDKIMHKTTICTMKASINFCKLPPIRYGQYKWPKLQELYYKLFGHEFSNSHDALADITATKDCYYELKRRNII